MSLQLSVKLRFRVREDLERTVDQFMHLIGRDAWPAFLGSVDDEHGPDLHEEPPRLVHVRAALSG